jgi:hypothetical protein
MSRIKKVELVVKNTKKDLPNANAIIFDGAIKQTHNPKVSAVKKMDRQQKQPITSSKQYHPATITNQSNIT